MVAAGPENLDSGRCVEAAWIGVLAPDGEDRLPNDACGADEIGHVLRLDVPFYVNRPGFDGTVQQERLAFRWVLSFSPAL